MCELFAMSSHSPTDARASLEAFARHGAEQGPHPDGWGLAYYADEDVRLVKDAEPASRSECLRFIREHPFASATVVAHIRKATQGRLAMKNCQPFARELAGRMHVFAHNGDLEIVRLRRLMPLGRFRPVGDTDSEHAFCALLERYPVAAALGERVAAVARFASALRSLGPANFLYSDGEALFIHGHRRRPRAAAPAVPPGLHLLRRRCPPRQEVVLAASVPLTGEPGWEPLDEGELVVAVRGVVVSRERAPAETDS